MDPTSAFKTEIFRPLATIIVPGFIAVAPFVIVLGHHVPGVTQFWKDHDGAFVSIYAVCVIAAGMILENLGAQLEMRVLDAYLMRANPRHMDEWSSYLQLKLRDEMIGQRYLRTLLMHLKFELSMVPALTIFWAGLLWINQLYATWSLASFTVLTEAIAVLVLYLIAESIQSAKALADTRRLILEATADHHPFDGATLSGHSG